MYLGPKNHKSPLNVIESRRNQETLGKHCCQTQTWSKDTVPGSDKGKAGRWEGLSMVDDQGGRIWWPAMKPRAGS